MRGSPFNARETVLVATPAMVATISIEGASGEGWVVVVAGLERVVGEAIFESGEARPDGHTTMRREPTDRETLGTGAMLR